MSNPYIDPENYAHGYNQSVENLKNKKEVVELDRLCYEVFMTEQGKKLMQIFEQRFITQPLVSPGQDKFESLCIYYEGFKQAFRLLKQSVQSHQQRIDAESLSND